MPETPEFLVEGILPANEVHLICGASGSGKTTWTFQEFLSRWVDGEDVAGHESFTVPYVYIALDRTRASVVRTLTRLGLQNKITNIVCLGDVAKAIPNKKERTLAGILKVALVAHPKSRLFIIEGFALIAGTMSKDYSVVAGVMQDASVFCETHKVTIVGICHSPKLKKDEKFQHPREKVLGSISWAAYGETIIVMDQDEETREVTVRIMPRNAASEEYLLRFAEAGSLTPVTQGTKVTQIAKVIANLTVGRCITRAEIVNRGEPLQVSPRTCDSAINLCVEKNILSVLEKGIFERTEIPADVIYSDSDIIVDD